MADITAAQGAAAGEEIAERMTRRAILGARYDAGLARDVISILTELEADLVGQIAAIDINGVARPSARRARLEQLLEQARKAIRANYRRVRLLTERDLDELFEIEVEATRAAVRGSFQSAGVRLNVSLPTDGYLAALAEETLVLGQPLSSYWARQEAGLIGAFRGEMEKGLTAGETINDLVRRIRGGTRQGQPVPGIMATSRNHAVAMVRTSAASVGNGARFATFEANLDVIEKYQHLSRLDGRTTQVCILRAGKLWDARTKAPIGHNLPFQPPPIHVSCRSVLVVVVIGAEPPTDQNGETWFRSLSQADQNELFGRGRADLYRRGDLTMSQLLDQSGRPIPLSDLRLDARNAGDRTVRRP